MLSIKEITRIDKNGEDITKNISDKLQLVIAHNLWQTHYQIRFLIRFFNKIYHKSLDCVVVFFA